MRARLWHRCLSSRTTFLRTSAQHGQSESWPLLQIRKKFPERSRLMSLIWRRRAAPMTLSRPDLLAIRSSSSGSGSSRRAVRTGDKEMSDSFIEVHLPFRQDVELRAEYISIHGGLRFGKVMEDLDALAASIAYLHCDDDAKVTLLTAAVDRIDLLKSFDVIADLRLRGFVTYVGKSSMEITMAVELNEDGDFDSHRGGDSGLASNGSGGATGHDEAWELGALAKFLFVARSADGKQAVPVPRLLLNDEGERELFALGKLRHQYRLRRNETSLFRKPPTEAESQLLHQLLISPPTPSEEGGLLPPAAVPMRLTQHSTLKICHPQERNIHNLIFGGYLMREAFELAYSTAVIFTKGEATFVTSVEDINFVHPVAIGSMLSFCARIVYVDRLGPSGDGGASVEIEGRDRPLSRMHLEVVADVIDPTAGTRRTTNTFHYTFVTPAALPPVIPETYTEAMKYLEGKRRVEFSNEQSA